MTIDAHQHFWIYDPVQYPWIGDDMARLRRDFLPLDLEQTTRRSDVRSVVSVQARQTEEETRWLLGLAKVHPWIAGVVGWAPLVSPDIRLRLEVLVQSKLKGLRHVLQDEPDERYLLRSDFLRGMRTLSDFGLTYDILIFERQLPQTIEFVDLFPEQLFVVDHAAKPRIRAGVIEPWRTHMRELARRPNVFCKLSGLVTEALPRPWSAEQLQPYAETVVEAFGPERVMFGSDWPVCLAACDYGQWLEVARGFIARLSQDERAAILDGTARRAYRLSPRDPA